MSGVFSFFGRLDRGRRRLLLGCFYAFFCNGMMALCLGSAMPDLKAAHGLSDASGGLLLSVHSLGNLAASFLSGLLPLYLGRRRSIVTISAAAAAGLALIAFCGLPGLLAVAFALTGFGRGGVANFDNYEVNVLTDGDASASNVLHATFALGAILSPMLFLALRGPLGWSAGVAVVAGCVALSALNLSLTPMADDRPDRRERGARSLAFLKDPAYLVLAGMMFCYISSEYAVNGWLVTYIQSKDALLASLGGTNGGLDAALAAYSQSMATLLWTVILAGRLACAWLSRRVSVKKLMLIAAAGEALGFAGMLFSNRVELVTLSVAALGFCMAGVCPMIYADGARFINAYPMATGVMMAVGAFGGVFMPGFVGLLADRHGFAGGMGAILGAICLMLAFAAVNAAMKPAARAS